MPSIFDRARALLKAPQPTAADLERGVSDATAALQAAEAEQASLTAQSQAMLTEPDAARSAHRAKIAAAADRVADARDYAQALGERHAGAVAAEANAARLTAYRDADAQAEAAARSVATRYPKLARELVALIREAAEAEIVVLSANAFLPEGAERLKTPEERVRDLPGTPMKHLPQRDTTSWCFVHSGRPVADDDVASIGDAGKGTHELRGAPVEQVTRRATRWIPGLPLEAGPRLADLSLPGLKAGDTAFADARSSTPGGPSAVLRRLDALAATQPQPRPLPTEQESVLVIRGTDPAEPADTVDEAA